jgi:hypothetical protein
MRRPRQRLHCALSLSAFHTARRRTWAKAIGYNHPHTAKALDTLAESYDWEAVDTTRMRLDCAEAQLHCLSGQA